MFGISFKKLCCYLWNIIIGAENVPTIVYKDDQFIILNKPYDIMINSNDNTKYTVQTFLRENYPELVKNTLKHEFYFAHRLDFSTSGIMCIPLNKAVCRITSEAFEQRLIQKYYVALVRGFISQELLHIVESIGEDLREKDVKKMCASSNPYCISRRHAETFMLVLETGYFENYPATKILLKPTTGRRHQLRVHCHNLGHTIIGDYTYSNRKDVTPYRMFLHSLRLKLPHPEPNLDVSTPDPFRNKKTLKNWTSAKVLNCLNNLAYTKLDNYANVQHQVN